MFNVLDMDLLAAGLKIIPLKIDLKATRLQFAVIETA